MNILSINNFNISSPFRSQKAQQKKDITTSSYGLTMAKPLLNDTVSFKAVTVKQMVKPNLGIPRRDAITAHLDAATRQPEITNFFKKLFEPLTASKKYPLNPIEDVRGRAKGILSIWEKANTREWNSLTEVYKNMTDLNGVKCVLRDSSPENVNKVLGLLLGAITSGVLILEEAEVKRPEDAKLLKKSEVAKYDYIQPVYMKKFVKDAQKASGKTVKYDDDPDYSKSNYTAVHFLFRFPGQKRVFEFQLMGHDVSVFKGMDDLFFKILNNKRVDDEFKPIENLIKPLMKEGNEDYLEKFNKYRAESFIFQREKEPTVSKDPDNEFFLPLKYDISHQKLISHKEYQKLVDNYNIVGNPYDFNNIYKIYKACRRENDATRDAYETVAKISASRK